VHRDSVLIKRTNSMHQYADIYLLQRQTLHASSVKAPIIRSSKNCICYLWYRSWYWYRYWSSGTNTMTYSTGSRYSFWNSWGWALWRPKHVEFDVAVNKCLCTDASSWSFLLICCYKFGHDEVCAWDCGACVSYQRFLGAIWLGFVFRHCDQLSWATICISTPQTSCKYEGLSVLLRTSRPCRNTVSNGATTDSFQIPYGFLFCGCLTDLLIQLWLGV
jgi:hypothetical protein